MFISQRCVLCYWSAVFQRCRRRRQLPPVHRLPVCHLEAILDMNNVATSAAIFYHRRRGRCSSDTDVSSPNPVQRDILPHRHSQLSDLTIRLYTTTSLKSVSLKRWLHHQMFKLSSDQFNSRVANHVTSHSSFSLVNRLTADVYRYYDHKYVNIHRHQLFIFSEINNG